MRHVEARRPPPPRERIDVAVIGGGLAGLVATYRLQKAGVDARLYEGSNRLGGRAWSLREPGYAEGEHGGQFIDSTHSELLSLCSQLGLELADRLVGPDRAARRLDGKRVTDRQLTDEFDASWERIPTRPRGAVGRRRVECLERRDGGARSPDGRGMD